MRTRCKSKCRSAPEPGHTTIQTFERRGSKIKVTIRNIPASVCPVCHQSYVDRETARNLDRLIEPFHGKHRHIPALPPADVTIDFAEAVAAIESRLKALSDMIIPDA